MEERQFKGIWIPKEIWLTNELSLQEKVILVEIESLEDEERGCFASNNYFAKFFNLTPSRVSQIINLLVEKNYLEVDYIKKGKQTINRVIRIKRPPYPEVFNLLNRGIKYSKEGYLENCEENNISSNNILKENNISKDILKEKGKITPPTLEEIEAYCKDRKNNVDAKRFFDYYEANNWRDGNGKRVKSWKQKMIANWETNSNQPKKETKEEKMDRIMKWAAEQDRLDEERKRNEQNRNK